MIDVVDSDEKYAETVIKALNFESCVLQGNYTYIHGIPDWLTTYNAGVDRLPAGKIIATAELVECWEISCIAADNFGKQYANLVIPPDGEWKTVYEPELLFGDWSQGLYAWELRNIKVLAEPVHVRGQQGLWNCNFKDAK